MDAGPTDAGTDAGPTDAGPTDAGPVTSSDASVGDACFFNFQCAADQTCTDCTEEDGCFCEVGTRGTAQVGEACSDSGDCATGNCLDVNGTSACTLPCATAGEGTADCGGLFPDCGHVPFTDTDNLCRTATSEDG